MKVFFLFISVCFLLLNLFHGGDLGIAVAQQDWKQEYAAVCSATQKAMTLSSAELKNYIAQCDKLQDRISELDGMEGGTERKVYEKRLQMCRDLYKFTLEYKDK